MPSAELRLHRDAFGKLVATLPDGSLQTGVVPVRAYPISAPDLGISLVAPDGHEIAWFDRMDDVPPGIADLIREELSSREFMPELRAILDVSSFATPSTWRVETDRGPTTLVLKSEDDIRRLPGMTLLIADSNGIQYIVRDRNALDRHSRRLLGRFM